MRDSSLLMRALNVPLPVVETADGVSSYPVRNSLILLKPPCANTIDAADTKATTAIDTTSLRMPFSSKKFELSEGGANHITARLICVSANATLSVFMTISLFALDLDGTLLNHRGQISERNLAAIKSARATGVRVALVTGRRFRDSRPIALELGLDVPLISHNGALTKHARTLETVSVLPLPLSAARQALEVGRKADADALLSDDHEGLGVLVYDHLSGDNASAQMYVSWARRLHGDEDGKNAVRQVDSLDHYLDHDPIHLAFSGSCGKMDQLESLLNEQMTGSVKVLCTKYPEQDFTLLDVLNTAASKGAGVAAAASELGFATEEIMAG